MIIEIEQISLGTVEVEVLGGSTLVFDVYAGNPLVTETVLLEVGPVGPPGPKGDVGNVADFSIGDLMDVAIASPLADGEVLIVSNNKLRNRPGVELVDGGNF